MREDAVLTRARREFTRSGGYAIKTSGDAEPDLVGSVAGQSVVVETKQPGEKPRPDQYAKLRRWASSGAIALWTDSDHWYRVMPDGQVVFVRGGEFPFREREYRP